MIEPIRYPWSGAKCSLRNDCDMDHIVDPLHPGVGVYKTLCAEHRGQIDAAHAADVEYESRLARIEAESRKLKLIKGGA